VHLNVSRGAAILATGVVSAAVGFGVIQAAAVPDEPDGTRTAQVDPVGDQTSMPLESPVRVPEHLDVSILDRDAGVPIEDVDPSVFDRGMVLLADCPEALEFFSQPDVVEFYETNFGHAPGPNDRWADACPEVAQLKVGYADARSRTEQSGR